MNKSDQALKPCPFCGGPVKLERAHVRNDINGKRQFWGVVCRNTSNLGGTCCMEQVPSASQEAAIERWNRRALSQSEAPADQPTPGVNQEAPGVSSGGNGRTEDERERFEVWWHQCLGRGYLPKQFEIWQAAKRDAITQAPQEPAVEKWEVNELIAWLLGENGEFPDRPKKVEGKTQPLYWWRTELRQRWNALIAQSSEGKNL